MNKPIHAREITGSFRIKSDAIQPVLVAVGVGILHEFNTADNRSEGGYSIV